MSEPCYNAKYLVLHFMNGRLAGTKVCRSWRGAMMSKRNHERPHYSKPFRNIFQYTDAQIAAIAERYNAVTRILPIEAILAIKGLEKVDTDLSAEDMAILRKMGIDI